MKQYQILAISGSLRSASLNSAVLRVVATLAPDDVQIHIYQGLADLPHFNPDLEGQEPATVLDFRRQLREADGVLIACPEYAHGLPGTFKNSLDWVVGSAEFVYKPVALINLFERSTWAPALLKETLAMMTANVIEPASITLGFENNKVGEDLIMSNVKITQALRASINELVLAIQQQDTQS